MGYACASAWHTLAAPSAALSLLAASAVRMCPSQGSLAAAAAPLSDGRLAQPPWLMLFHGPKACPPPMVQGVVDAGKLQQIEAKCREAVQQHQEVYTKPVRLALAEQINGEAGSRLCSTMLQY